MRASRPTARALLRLLAVAAATLCGCTGDDGAGPTRSKKPDAGDDCAERRLPDGTCLHAGISADACAEGFRSDGADGCEPVLPTAPCPPGQLAVPGDTTCRPVAPCSDARYGEAPVDASTEYVDAAFAGVSDGSADRPWKSIQDGVDHAESGAVVAVAAGTYAEDLTIDGKPVRVWGRCPDLVKIECVSQTLPGVRFFHSDGAELHAVSVTSPYAGIGMSAATHVLLDRIWVHETGYHALVALDTLGAPDVLLQDSLIEAPTGGGVVGKGATVAVTRSVVRDVKDDSSHTRGAGLAVESSSLTLVGSVVSNVLRFGVFGSGSALAVESSVVTGVGAGSPNDGHEGVGIYASDAAGTRSTATVRGSLVEKFVDKGVGALGSDLIIEHTVVRDAATPPGPATAGNGIVGTNNASVSVREVLVQRAGLVSFGLQASHGSAEGLATRDSTTGLGAASFGQSTMDVTRSLFDSARVAGLCAYGGSMNVRDTIVRGTLDVLEDQNYGDGLVVLVMDSTQADASLANVRIERSARAGISNFGGTVRLGGVELECNPVAIDGEVESGLAPNFEETGQLACGCQAVDETCTVQSSNLAPPSLDGL